MFKNLHHYIPNLQDSEINRRKKIKELEIENKKIYLEKIKHIENFQKKLPFKYLEPINEIFSNENDENNSLDISFYKELLNSSKKEELYNFLPTRENKDFKVIMNLLIIDILQEINEIEDFLIKENLTKLEQNEFINEIKEKRFLMNELINYRDTLPKSLSVSPLKENILIYLESPTGNFYALQDLKNIDFSFYPTFLNLLNSIKNGTFKNVKAYKNNVLNVYEVKDFKTRILFQRISKNIYIIISIFIKKVDTSLMYREQTKSRLIQLRNSINYLKKSLNDPSYLDENKKINNQVINILKRK